MSSDVVTAIPSANDAPAAGLGLAVPTGDDLRRASEPVRDPLRLRALRGSAWTMSDYFVARGLALVSNVVLSYLLAAQAFGLMATVSVFLTGLQMFSDIGIGPNIIFSKRGDDPKFLNTAWTIQVIRGSALFLLSGVVAWPVAAWYAEPSLLYLLPICGFTSCIQGFTSTSLVTLNREMRLGTITILDIIAQVLSIGTMIAWASFISRDVWALVVGSYVASIFRVTYSHFLVRGHQMRFAWNAEDARSMLRFGRWIFISTALTFLAMQLDRLMFAKMLGMTMAGVYNNAVQFAIVPQQLIKKIGAVVAFPVLAEVVRERPEELPRQFKRVRYPLLLVSLTIIVALIVVAKPLISLLYKNEYEGAGPMLQILAVGSMGGLLNSTYGSALLAMGKTFQIMTLLAMQIVFLIVASLLGYHLHPQPEFGFIWGVASVEWLNYPATAAVMARYGLWQPRIDGAVILISAMAVLLAFIVL
jgi:O-antigen/teichoic acid export membrane protein